MGSTNKAIRTAKKISKGQIKATINKTKKIK